MFGGKCWVLQGAFEERRALWTLWNKFIQVTSVGVYCNKVWFKYFNFNEAAVIRSWKCNCVWSVEGTRFPFIWFLIPNICNFFMQRYLYEQNITTDLRLKLFDCCNVATSKTTPTSAMTSRPVLWGHPDIKWQVTLRSVDNLGVWLASCLITFMICVLYVGPMRTVDRVPWDVSK
jgi:hypothetical protein